MFALTSVLGLLTKLPAAVAAASEFKEVFAGIKSTFSETDQAVLQEAYEDLIADNDEGHARLQAKLAEAASR